MSKVKLKTAVLGLNGEGLGLLKTALQSEFFEIKAVADRDSQLAEKTGRQHGFDWYDDYRQLIMQNQVDCLLVAAGMYSCEEYIRTAIKKKFHLFKLSPPGRNFEEALQFVQMAKEEKVKFAIGNSYRFDSRFKAMHRYLQEEKIEHVSMITAVCNFPPSGIPEWQKDLKFSGGGVLLRNCYGVVDQMISTFGMPETIYSLNTNYSLDMKQRLYRTEDVCVVSMKFRDTLMGNIIASRNSAAENLVFKIYGKDKILTITDSGFAVESTSGELIENFECSDDEYCCLGRGLDNFAMSILLPEENQLCSCANENLKNMAVIESAYLSSKTSMPEEPSKLLRMAEIEPRLIWPAG